MTFELNETDDVITRRFIEILLREFTDSELSHIGNDPENADFREDINWVIHARGTPQQ